MAPDAFPIALDALRRSLPPTRARSRLTDFRTFAKSLPARRNGGGTEWAVAVGSKRLMYDVRKASTAGTLVLYSHFVRYDTKSWKGILSAPLFTTPMNFDPTKATARPIGDRSLNTLLVDKLQALGVTVDASGDTPILGGASAIASLEGDDRLAKAAKTPVQLSAYLDHRANPALLRNPLLHFFVAGSATSPWTVPSGRPSGPIPSVEASEDHLASGEDGGEPSDLRPQAVASPAQSRVPLDMDQQAAVEMAIRTEACVIDGPPGTGKTQVIAALAEYASSKGFRVLVTSTEESAIAVAKRRTAGLGSVAAMTIEEAAAARPPTIGEPDFDILIIDEASRMPLASAATVISRSRSVVVIGDDRQMRPETGAETLLDRARTLRLPGTTLRFHYRSRERSLITPSNLLSYEMRLRTVPTPTLDATRGLRVAFLEGSTKETSSGTENPAEADVIVARLRSHAVAKDPRSIGVITANRTQRDLVWRLVKSSLTKPQIEALSPIASEPLLIASASECQGEERDVILISTVYDRASRRLGPFEKPAAMSMMNVMLSRSRQEMAIITCYRPTPRCGTRTQSSASSPVDTLFFVLEAATTTETRQQPPEAFRSIARKLNARIDHLGVVLGLRRPTDDAYRVGIIPVSEEKPEVHWDMIDRQLQAVGWKTIRLAEQDCRRAPSDVLARVSDLYRG